MVGLTVRGLAIFVLGAGLVAAAPKPGTRSPEQAVIAGHVARYDAQGRLLPWTSWNVALDREMHFYQQCPADHGYPQFISATILDGDCVPVPERTDTIPATQNGMGIISYLKFYELRGRRDPRLLRLRA